MATSPDTGPAVATSLWNSPSRSMESTGCKDGNTVLQDGLPGLERGPLCTCCWPRPVPRVTGSRQAPDSTFRARTPSLRAGSAGVEAVTLRVSEEVGVLAGVLVPL